MTPVPRQGWFFLIEFSKWYFSKYWQVPTRRVFAQTVTYVIKYFGFSHTYSIFTKILSSNQFRSAHLPMFSHTVYFTYKYIGVVCISTNSQVHSIVIPVEHSNWVTIPWSVAVSQSLSAPNVSPRENLHKCRTCCVYIIKIWMQWQPFLLPLYLMHFMPQSKNVRNKHNTYILSTFVRYKMSENHCLKIFSKTKISDVYSECFKFSKIHKASFFKISFWNLYTVAIT